jgi:hypothetical protein
MAPPTGGATVQYLSEETGTRSLEGDSDAESSDLWGIRWTTPRARQQDTVGCYRLPADAELTRLTVH